MNGPEHLEKKKLAALAYALGWTRGVLDDVLRGDVSLEQVRRIYEATAGDRIAESIGMSVSELDVDFELLTETEKHRIQGYEPG